MKNIIKIKGNNKNIVIPLDPLEGKPWVEACNDEVAIRKVYQVLHDECDNVKPNFPGEIITGHIYQLDNTQMPNSTNGILKTMNQRQNGIRQSRKF